jgi:CheY-like chemotaxis protein
LVEDNEAARGAIQEALQLLNYTILTAANGREALAILQQPDNAIALILSDVVMPEMGGIA